MGYEMGTDSIQWFIGGVTIMVPDWSTRPLGAV